MSRPRLLAASLGAVPILALAQFNLERVPEPTALAEPLGAQLRGDKTRLDRRHQGLRSYFDEYQAQCGTVELRKSAACIERRELVLGSARAYIRDACAYRKANIEELEKRMETERAEIARYQEQIRRIGLEATAAAYEQWTDISQQQLADLEKEKIGHSISAALQSLQLVGQALGGPMAAKVPMRVLSPQQAESIAAALRSRGVTDERLLKPIAQLATPLSEEARIKLMENYVESVKANVDISLQRSEARKPDAAAFDQAWAKAQALVTLTDLVTKTVVAPATGQALAAVGPVAAAAPGVIKLVGHGTVYFYTYGNMQKMANLEEIQLVQLQMQAGLMEGPILRLRSLKEKRAAFTADKACGF